MTIETALYPTQLNATLPPQSDIVREGAGHLRLLKTVVKTTFPNLGGAWNATQTEANYIVGVTGPIQAQFAAKFDKTGGDVNGNVNFTGTGRRITGDFSNATVASRTLFQTSTANTATTVGVLPNGTSDTAVLAAYANSDPANTSSMRMLATSIDGRLDASRSGTGNYLPMTFYTGRYERLRIDTSGNVLATSGALGYGVGVGGTVVQATNKSASVTLNKVCGQITMHNAALSGGAAARFTMNNTFVGATDEVSVWLVNPISPSAYDVAVDGITSGVCAIRLRNNEPTSYSDSVVIGFAVRKVTTS